MAAKGKTFFLTLVGLGAVSLVGAGGYFAYSFISNLKNATIHREHFADYVREKEKYQQVHDFLTDESVEDSKMFADDNSSLRGTKGTWSAVQNYAVTLGNGDYNSGDILPGDVIDAVFYETPMFRYAIDTHTFLGSASILKYPSNPESKEINATAKGYFETIITEFENNVNYGPGAHIYAAPYNGSRSVYKPVFVKKPIIEFIGSDDVISWGGHQGIEVSLSRSPKNYGAAFSQLLKAKTSLLLHEYGHHETIMSADYFFNANKTLFDKAKDDLKASRSYQAALASGHDFLKYWDFEGTPGDEMFADKSILDTIFGVQIKGLDVHPQKDATSIIGPYEYMMKAAEWITRTEMIFESDWTIRDYLNPQINMDVVGPYMAFGETPLNTPYIQDTYSIYKKDIYAYNQFTTKFIDHNLMANKQVIANVLDSSLNFNNIKILDSKNNVVLTIPSTEIVATVSEYRYHKDWASIIAAKANHLKNPKTPIPQIMDKDVLTTYTIVKTKENTNQINEALKNNGYTWQFFQDKVLVKTQKNT